MSAQPVGYSQTPESARWMSRISSSVVADDGRDRDFRRDVARHALADHAEPLLDLPVVIELAPTGRVRDVGRDREHLFEALLLVQALRESEAGARDARQRFGPSMQIERGGAAGLVLVAQDRPSRSSYPWRAARMSCSSFSSVVGSVIFCPAWSRT